MYCRPLRLFFAALLLLWGCDPLVDAGSFSDQVPSRVDVHFLPTDLSQYEGDSRPSADLGHGELAELDEDCAGLTCGDYCCAPSETCFEDACCQRSCAGRKCGDDGCGGTCGECLEPQEVCQAGVCVCQPDCHGKECGEDGCGGSCGECGGDCTLKPPWGDAQRIHALSVGVGGYPGEALDVDENPGTCAPPTKCEAGLNNQLSGTMVLLENAVDVAGELQGALAGGELNLVLEWREYVGENMAFELRVHPGIPAEPVEKCDGQTETCSYVIAEETLGPGTCIPLVVFLEAQVAGGVLDAGGKDSIFVFRLPLSTSATLLLTARMARITGVVSQEVDGLSISDGLIGGAIRKDELIAALSLIPSNAELPVSVETVEALLELFVVPDVDTDGDGALDAASIGLKFAARPAVISGFAGGDNLVCSPDGLCLSDIP